MTNQFRRSEQFTRMNAVAMSQVGWLGHNDKKFYYLDESSSCQQNNAGGYSPIWEQIGSYDSEGILND